MNKKNKFNSHSEINLDSMSEIIKTLTSFMRIDIKNFGTENNSTLITADNAKIATPTWFSDDTGQGKIFSSSSMKSSFKIKVINDGKLSLSFKGIDKRHNNIRLPAWCDYKSIKINGKELLTMPVATWHDKSFKHEIFVKNGEEFEIEIEQQFHQYIKEKLKELLLKLDSTPLLVKKNIDKIINSNLLSKFILPIDYEILSDYPNLDADAFISLGHACRAAYWLKKYSLRTCSLPFDWMMGYTLQTILKTFINGVTDWFIQYYEDYERIGRTNRYVIDTLNNIISMHAFPTNKSVKEYMPEFKATFIRRYERMKNLFLTKKKIVFICYRNDDISEFYFFLHTLNELYPHCNFSLINITHSNNENIIKYSTNNINIYQIYSYDINENGGERKNNPDFWIGNTKLWKNICSKMSFNTNKEIYTNGEYMNKNNIITVKNAEDDPDTQAEIIIQNKIDYTPKVSVIIPVYNVEEYLRVCLDSVVNQTLKEIEIICIDDGSTDNSLEILKEYAQKDNRITVIKQENLHAGVARNAGLAVAKGEYLSFLDSDDFFELNMLEKMYFVSIKNKIEICICDVQFYDNNTKKLTSPKWTLKTEYIPKKAVFNSFDISENIFHITNNWPWNKMFNKSFVNKLNLHFQSTKHTNDTYFVCIGLMNAKNITIINEKLIYYRTNVNKSLTSCTSRNNAPTDIDFVLSAIHNEIKKNKSFYRSFVNLCCEHLTWNLKNITDSYARETLQNKIIDHYFYDIPNNLPESFFYSQKIYNDYTFLLEFLPRKITDRNSIIDKIENFDIISFDLFDTILLRPYSKPSDLFVHLGKIINDENFYSLRIAAEKNAREKSKNEEILLTDIYKYLPPQYKFVQKMEEQLELNLIQVNPHIKNIIDYAEQKSKKIIFISDMYLNEELITKMLKKFDLNKFTLFLSSKIGKTKSKGSLFTHIISNLEISPSQILHIGDNAKSDICVPQSLGIAVHHIPKYNESYQIKYLSTFNSHSNTLDAFIIQALIKLNLHIKNNSYWYKIGYSLGGPLTHSYINFIDDFSKSNKLDTLLFIARDGFVLKKIYPLIVSNALPTHYIYASRGLISNINKDTTLLKEYQNYLESEKIEGINLGLIDTTTINFSAQKFLQQQLTSKKILGLYWLANKNNTDINYKYIFSRPHKIEALNFLVETLITAPHPPVNKIHNNIPIYEDISNLEQKRCSIYKEIEAGIIDFSKDFIEIFGKNNIKIFPSTVQTLLYDWIENYTQIDYNNFSLISHSGNTNNTNNISLSNYLDRFPSTKISLIIPVYNVEKYLAECLTSAISQTLKEIEIICINDGSIDNSLNILEEYARKDKRIKIINQENQGLACSRNNALKIASGKYIVFLDSDDYLSIDALDKIYHSMEHQNLDMLSYSGINFDSDTKQQSINNYWNFLYLPTNFNYVKFNFKICSDFAHKMAVSSCLTAYKLQFLKQNKINFPPHLFFEDNVFFTKSLTKAHNCGIIKDKLYFRRVHQNSITQNWEKHFSDYLKIVNLVLSYLKDENIENNILKNYINSYIDTIKWQYDRFSIEGQKKYQKEIDILINKYTNSKATTQYPLLFKDIGFGCNAWCEPKNVTGDDIKSYTYDLSDNIYTRYVSWDPIKEGSCDVEIKRLYAVEKRTKKIIEFPVNKIVSSGKVSENKVEFRNQKGCWIGCTIEGAYESFTIEAKIKNI